MKKWLAVLILICISLALGSIACETGDVDDKNESDEYPGDDDATVGDDDISDDDDDAEDDDDATDDDDDVICDGCLIGSVCYPDGVTNPENTCEICRKATSSDSWTDNDGAICDDGTFCNGVDTCFGGACYEHSGDPCHYYEVCNESESECYDPAREAYIPVGSFWMGCEPNDTECWPNESPRHEATLSSYYIDIYEVTNDWYVDFLNANGNDCDGFICVDSGDANIHVFESGGTWYVDSEHRKDHPLVAATWYGAKKFCEWIDGRLPTEAEWEKAAKGALEHYIFPWGDTIIANAANYWHSGYPFSDGTTPVGFYDGTDHWGAYQTTDGRCPYGVHDMAGNVVEWVNDWYDGSYYSSSPLVDPKGPDSGMHRVKRGGSWVHYAEDLRISIRYDIDPGTTFTGGGFRCARN